MMAIAASTYRVMDIKLRSDGESSRLEAQREYDAKENKPQREYDAKDKQAQREHELRLQENASKWW